MCLAIPGKILSRHELSGGLPGAKVQFGSVLQDVCLAYTPQAQVGEYVIVHVGFALQVLDEKAARETLQELGIDEIPE